MAYITLGACFVHTFLVAARVQSTASQMITTSEKISGYWHAGASTPPGTHPRQYLVSRGRNILYPPKIVIVVFIIVNSVLTVYIIWRNGWRKMHQNAQICMLQFKIFPEAMPPNLHVGAPPHTSPLRQSGAARLSRLARGLNRRSPNVC